MAFEKFDARTWGWYYRYLNRGVPVEECPLELTDEEKKAYVEDAEYLAEERKKHPGVPIAYDETAELDW